MDKKLPIFSKRLDVCFENLKKQYTDIEKAIHNTKKDYFEAENNIRRDISTCSSKSELVIKTRSAQAACTNELDRLIQSFDTLKFDSMLRRIQDNIIAALRYNILEALKQYQIIGGKSAEELIEQGINQTTDQFSPIIDKELKPIISEITSVVGKMEKSVGFYNQNEEHKLTYLSQKSYNTLGDIFKDVLS